MVGGIYATWSEEFCDMVGGILSRKKSMFELKKGVVWGGCDEDQYRGLHEEML
jgi:hypothetical protein